MIKLKCMNQNKIKKKKVETKNTCTILSDVHSNENFIRHAL